MDIVGLKQPEESAAFIVGQIYLGGLGLLREMHLNKHGFNKNIR